ncbi:MAG: redoxin domain-containing protein [Fastidiosipilaceae bacterium]|jgi:peroxiredoxin
MSELIKAGVAAPDFSLADQNEQVVSLADFKGKKVLLSWHPLAWTSVCMDQMRSLERNYDRFTDKNTVVLGLSVDPQPSKSAWAKVLCLDNLLILSDFNPLGAVSKAYGNYIDQASISGRANVLIDENGVVLWSKQYDIPELPDVEEVLAQL